MEMGGWHGKRIKCEGFERSILKICIIQILRKGGELQQSKGWKCEVGRGGERSEKDLEGVL